MIGKRIGDSAMFPRIKGRDLAAPELTRLAQPNPVS